MSEAQPIRFAGYAGLFDLVDAGRDTIKKGAFSQTLNNRDTTLPLLWQHRPDQCIGRIEHIREDIRGLRVIGSIDNENSRAGQMLRNASVSGLSFGYRAREVRSHEQGRDLLGIDLFEISLVTNPLQFGARVHFVLGN